MRDCYLVYYDECGKKKKFYYGQLTVAETFSGSYVTCRQKCKCSKCVMKKGDCKSFPYYKKIKGCPSIEDACNTCDKKKKCN